MPQPIYTTENCKFAYQLNWSLSIFWRTAVENDDWFAPLAEQVEKDGVRLLRHRFIRKRHSQFLVSTKPHRSPSEIARFIKGRLQHLVTEGHPRAFQRNYSIRSIGSTKRTRLDGYLAKQLSHHPMADARVAARFADYQFHDPNADLAALRWGTHAPYRYSLHLSFVHAERWRQIDDVTLRRLRGMIVNANQKKKHLLSRAALLPDHIHMAMGCGLTESPTNVALSYMNNLAFAQGMRPAYQHSAFIGTFGEYDLGAIAPRE